MKMERLPFGWNGKSWPQDKFLMELVFEVHGLLEIAQGQVTRKSLEAVETFDPKQALIKQTITSTIPFHRQRQLSRCKTASEMWVRLCEVYESPIMKERAISRAMRELTSLQCGPRQDVQVHMWKMLGLRFTLGFYGHKVSDNTMVTIMLESLPDSEACRILRRHVQYGVNRNKRIPERLRELIDIGECYTIYQAEARNDLDKSDAKKCRQRRSIRTSKKCCWHCGVLGNVRSQCPDRIHG